jgi:hypothetical protein
VRVRCAESDSHRARARPLSTKAGSPRHEKILSQLGKFKTDGGCPYIKHLADVHMNALEELCAASLAHMAEKYPASD